MALTPAKRICLDALIGLLAGASIQMTHSNNSIDFAPFAWIVLTRIAADETTEYSREYGTLSLMVGYTAGTMATYYMRK